MSPPVLTELVSDLKTYPCCIEASIRAATHQDSARISEPGGRTSCECPEKTSQGTVGGFAHCTKLP